MCTNLSKQLRLVFQNNKSDIKDPKIKVCNHFQGHKVKVSSAFRGRGFTIVPLEAGEGRWRRTVAGPSKQMTPCSDWTHHKPIGGGGVAGGGSGERRW
jgi:hypothetical protein